MEKDIIQKFVDQKTLIFYGRYVDDCLLVVRKRSKNTILTQMNNFDSFLKFTAEEMQNNCIKFLDTKVIISNNKLEFRQFFKHDNVGDVIHLYYSLSISTPYPPTPLSRLGLTQLICVTNSVSAFC